MKQVQVTTQAIDLLLLVQMEKFNIVQTTPEVLGQDLLALLMVEQRLILLPLTTIQLGMSL